METKKLTRRDFLNLMAVAGSGAVLAACGGAPTTTAPAATTAPTGQAGAAEDVLPAAKPFRWSS